MPSEEQYRALEKRISFLERMESGTGLVDYFATSTKIGWSGYTASNLTYKQIGGLLYVFFYIVGTSDAVTTSFTLPYSNAAGWEINAVVRIANSGAYAPGIAAIQAASDTLGFYPDAAGSAWTASGVKDIRGQIVVPI